MTRRRILVGTLLAFVLVCAGLLGALVDVVHPEPADPTIVRARTPRVVRNVAAAAADPSVPVVALRVTGTVTDLETGEPIEGAEVRVGDVVTWTDSAGEYVLTGDGSTVWIVADAVGYREEGWVLRGDDEDAGPVGESGGVFRHDFALSSQREVRVYCAGMPGDGCGDMAVQCTSPWVFVGSFCRYDRIEGATECACSAGEAAIRGGGRAVLIDADATEAWLDFRDAGAIVGRVVAGGAPPAECEVMAVRVPTALEDLPRGMVAARRTRCEEDGSFALEGVVTGDWEIVVEGNTTPDELGRGSQRTLVPRHVAPRTRVDVGTIDLEGGGVIEGTLVDGVTGQPLSYKPVLAYREGEAGERVTPQGDDSDPDGRFRIEGLPAGSWVLAHPLSPQEYVRVTVREGETTSGVTVRTSDATALAENGFALEDDAGALVVSDVTPGSPADDAGLEPGEEVVGVLVGGVDVAAAFGETRGKQIARTVLGHWDGPGVTLVVRAPDGTEEEVPLEW